MQHPLPQPCAPAVPTAASTSAASPEAVKAIFSRAVHAVFGEWTALKLAVENEFAGSGTRARALALLDRVHQGLLASAAVHRDELEDMLDLALIDDFNLEAEDESPKEVAQILCTLHREASAGLTTTADAVLQRVAGKRSWVDVPPPPRARGDDDSSDDECDDVDDDAMDDGSGKPAAMEEEEGAGSQPWQPQVDEDGFQVVSTRRNRGRRQ